MALAAPLLACWGPAYESVHFNDARPDFLRLPRPWWKWPGDNRALAPGRHGRFPSLNGRDEQEPDTPEPGSGLPRLESMARRAEQAGQFPEAARRWLAYRKALFPDHSSNWDDPGWGAVPRGGKGLEDRILAL